MKDKISTAEFAFLNISAILGVGILVLPRRAAENAGVDGIIAIIISGLIVTLVSYMYAKLSAKFESQTILEFSEFLIGKYLTRIIALLFSLHLLFTLALEIRTISSSIKLFLLYNTPLEVIIITLLLISAVAVNYGLLIIARISSNYSVLTISALLIILALNLKYFDPEVVMHNFFSISLWNIFQTAFKLTTGYLGFAVILFSAPLLSKPKKMVKVSVASVLAVTLIYALTTLVSYGHFNVLPNEYLIYPTAILARAVSIPGFIERVDLLFMAFWILASYLTITIRWYTASYSLSKIVPQKNYTVFTFLSLPLIYISSLIVQSYAEVEKVSGHLMYTAWGIFIPIVFILFILSFIRKNKSLTNKS